ncbi:alpha-mannosidase [Candidatus Bathyarchaeota archaeon]|nr:alpha-mannosidase [Candidatus Bathyarchaeota archaeon]
MSEEIYLVANSHIDLSWLWTREETIGKICPETFTNVLNLMDKYPLLCYAQSSAQIYEWLETYHPEIFRRIREKVKEGRWEIVSGSWVEHNANLLCGESLVRQYLLGKRYFMKKFNVDVKVAWLPDSFGFCWALPQVLKKCGLDYFLTHKLKWQIERMKPPIPFPYYVFWWESPDGSKVLAYHIVGSYAEDVNPIKILEQLALLERRHGLGKLLVLFGRGDHGGGPTEGMVREALRLMELQDPKAYPKVILSTSERWFQEVRAVSENLYLPVVKDELYVKTHRGTYTTEAKVKLHNRKCECLLLTAERFASIAMLLGMDYPFDDLKKAWKLLLLNQVHDNLDGTSIEEVYIQAEKDYEEVYKISRRVLEKALNVITSKVNTKCEGLPIVVFNPLSWCRSDVVELILEGDLRFMKTFKAFDCFGKETPVQTIEGGQKAIFVAEDVPSFGYKLYYLTQSSEESANSNLKVGEFFLENEFLRVEIDGRTGHVIRIYDKINGRDVLSDSGKGNVLQIYEDKPPNAPGGEPAWNMYLGALTELDKAEEIRVVEKGPVRATIKIVRKYGSSTFEQYVSIYGGIPRVDFTLKADWREKYKTLKVAFPLRFKNHWATYDMPFGVIQRYQYIYAKPPDKQMNLPRRPWELADKAKFEVPALFWINVDTENGDYGVALLNDCKYGFDIIENTIRMTLLRGPRRGYPSTPEQWADQSDNPRVGIHIIRYSLYAHKGDWAKSMVFRKGHDFNYPLIPWKAPENIGSLPKTLSVIEIKPDNVILSALKKAEDSDELVLRVYEACGLESDATLTTLFKPFKAVETDLIEWGMYAPKREFKISENIVNFHLNGHEIVTVKLSPPKNI